MNDRTQDAPAADQVVEQERDPMGKYNLPVLREIKSEELTKQTGIPRALFIPSSYGEAIEMAKMMCSGIGVPGYLRGSPSNCLAVLMQASRWGLDPYAVASKSYFVNDMIAYESQLVNAVITTSGVLHGRLKIWWEGQDTGLRCYVEGHIKGDDERKLLSQAIARVKVKNSPLWTVNPEQQLAYLTTRAWARLYIPEVLLGVYTPDEVVEGLPRAAAPAVTARTETVGPTPRTPRRSDFAQQDDSGASDQEAETQAAAGSEAESLPVEQEQDQKDPPVGQEPEPEVDSPVPDGFETWAEWADTVSTRLKTATTLPKLDAVTRETNDQVQLAPKEIREALIALYEEKAEDHRQAIK